MNTPSSPPRSSARRAPRRTVRAVVLALAATLAAVLGAFTLIAPAQATTAPYCGITWGSLAKQGSANGPVFGALLSNVRAGEQTCYDRLVIDVRGVTSMNSWHVGYVSQVIEDASGKPVPLRGGAFLQIGLGASDHTSTGTATYSPSNRRELVDVTGYRTFRQVAWAGSSEGMSSVGLGVRARLPFRVLTLTGIPGSSNGTRLVIDVANSW
jgi:hypothetical protein